MKPQTLQVGDVVQIDPAVAQKNSFFAGCFMVVSEPKSFGAQGYIMMPHSPRGELPGVAYFRCNWEDMEFVGHAVWSITSSSAGEPPREEMINPENPDA